MYTVIMLNNVHTFPGWCEQAGGMAVVWAVAQSLPIQSSVSTCSLKSNKKIVVNLTLLQRFKLDRLDQIYFHVPDLKKDITFVQRLSLWLFMPFGWPFKIWPTAYEWNTYKRWRYVDWRSLFLHAFRKWELSVVDAFPVQVVEPVLQRSMHQCIVIKYHSAISTKTIKD